MSREKRPETALEYVRLAQKRAREMQIALASATNLIKPDDIVVGAMIRTMLNSANSTRGWIDNLQAKLESRELA